MLLIFINILLFMYYVKSIYMNLFNPLWNTYNVFNSPSCKNLNKKNKLINYKSINVIEDFYKKIKTIWFVINNDIFPIESNDIFPIESNNIYNNYNITNKLDDLEIQKNLLFF